jgi:hypothetical protein
MDYWTEMGQHPEGFTLFARYRKLKHPWLALKLMRPGPAVRRRGESRRIWLSWNIDERRLGHDRTTDRLIQELPEIHDWVISVVEQYSNRELDYGH